MIYLFKLINSFKDTERNEKSVNGRKEKEKKKANLTVNGVLNSSDIFSKMTLTLTKNVTSPGNCCRKTHLMNTFP